VSAFHSNYGCSCRAAPATNSGQLLLLCPHLIPFKRLLQHPDPGTTRPRPLLPCSVAIFIGPSTGAALAPLTAAITALGTVGVCAAYTLLILPESLSEDAKAGVSHLVCGRACLHLAACFYRLLAAALSVAGAHQPPTHASPRLPACPCSPQAHRRHQQAHGHEGAGASSARVALGSTLRAARILLRSPLFKRLTICMMLTGVVGEGLQDLLVQYLQLKMDFGVKDVVSPARFVAAAATAAVGVGAAWLEVGVIDVGGGGGRQGSRGVDAGPWCWMCLLQNPLPSRTVPPCTSSPTHPHPISLAPSCLPPAVSRPTF
jgi:hypothetical protein